MKRCTDAVPLLGPMLDGALPDDDREWVDEHLRGCAGCRDRKALIAAQGEARRERLAARASQADFTGFADRVLARAAKEREARPMERLRVWGREMWGAHHRAVAAFGSLALAASIALGVVLAPPAEDEPVVVADASQPQLDEVDFGSHDGAVVELRDKTPVIWLSEDRP